MINLRRSRRRENQTERTAGTPLVVESSGGAPLLFLPANVATHLRYTISRMMREGALPKRLALVAALRGEGVTFLSRALGALIASDYGLQVCVVELNWWWPLAVSPADAHLNSMADLITGCATIEETTLASSLANFSSISAGQLQAGQRALVARSEQLEEALDELSERFDHVILDVPAVLASSDAVPLAKLAGCCYLVVRQGVTPLEKVNLALEEIKHLPLGGVIMNQVEMATPGAILKYIPQQ